MKNIRKLLAEYNLTPEDIVWEYLVDKLQINFERPQNDDEICRVYLGGRGVDIVHYPEDESEVLRESMMKLCGKYVYFSDTGIAFVAGTLYYLGEDKWKIVHGRGECKFSLNEVSAISGNTLMRK